MKKLIQQLTALIFGSLLMSTAVRAQDATDIMKKSHLAMYYAGNDAQMDVQMKLVDKKGSERIREFTMLAPRQSGRWRTEILYLFPQTGRCGSHIIHGRQDQ